MEPVIKLENVNFFYDKGKPTEFQALKNINLEIYPGDFVGVFGPSGCGKSTLLYIIAGVEKPQQGKVVVLNQDLTKLPQEDLAFYRQIGISIIFQTFNLIPSIRNIENVTLPMAFIGTSAEKRRKKGMELLKRLGIAELANRYPHELSGGQQQRVAIARALSNDPPIILADEPIGNLDSTNAKIVLNLLKEINQKEKKTVVMVTHQAWTLTGTVNRIFYMKDGEIVKVEEKTLAVWQEIKKFGSSYYYQKLFPKLKRTEVYARLLSYLLLRGHSREEIERFGDFVSQRLTRKINRATFEELLDRPFPQGGVGLWRQKAERISDYVEDIIKKRKELKKIYRQLERNPADPLFEEMIKIQSWLLEDYKFQLTPLQKERLREVISNRIRNIILPEHFVKVLDLPLEKGGVGLKITTALKMGEKLENILGR
jgi:putative ABC transport system ATP-binding protein